MPRSPLTLRDTTVSLNIENDETCVLAILFGEPGVRRHAAAITVA